VEHGAIHFANPGWKSAGVRPISISLRGEKYEAMLLFGTGDWVESDLGRWQEGSLRNSDLLLQHLLIELGFSFSVFQTDVAPLEAAMKTLTTISLALAVATAGAQTISQTQIRHIETSLNHLTVLEFGESVTTLAVADPDSFEIERHDDKVFVKPLREGVSTNLFVWTASHASDKIG
jgi:hypothetical protein